MLSARVTGVVVDVGVGVNDRALQLRAYEEAEEDDWDRMVRRIGAAGSSSHPSTTLPLPNGCNGGGGEHR
jgi:hypothetical protein